jgi:hypothetical protein
MSKAHTQQKTVGFGFIVACIFAAMSGTAFASSVVPAPTCALSISPSTVYSGDAAILSWSSQNSNLAVIDQGVGSVAVSGSQSIGNLTSSKTYMMTVYGQGGSASCIAQVGVLPRENQLPTCSITASPASLTQGNATTLIWNSTNAQNASISNGVGIVSTGGSKTVYPTQGVTTYTLTVNGTSGSNSCATTVTTDYNYNHYNQQPYCTISITLSWNAYGTNLYGPYIDNGVGSVALSGSRTVNAYQTTTYRMTFNDQQGRSASCYTTLHIGGSGSYYNPSSYPNYYVPLSRVPYTGTEDGIFFAFVLALTFAAWGTAGYMLYQHRTHIRSIIGR